MDRGVFDALKVAFEVSLTSKRLKPGFIVFFLAQFKIFAMNLLHIFRSAVFFVLMSAAQAQPAPPALPGIVSWACKAFYMPARSIWQRTVDLEFDANGVRTVKIDGVAVYTFNIQGKTILTAVDGERIQFDAEAQTWTSDLRGLVSSQGRCER